MGDYTYWSNAASDCVGYDAYEIAEKVSLATLQVIEGKAKYARDGVVFYESHFNWPLIAVIQRIALMSGKPIRVLDFGGAFGDVYLQNRPLIDDQIVFWRVVEQDTMLKTANYLPKVGKLFFGRFEDQEASNFDLIIVSSVLQYLPNYEQMISALVSLNAAGIFVDRTSFTEKTRYQHRVTKQVVRPPLYEASYPCVFFCKKTFISLFDPYEIQFEFTNTDTANIPSRFLGIYFEKGKPIKCLTGKKY
jgi:putative methyltransferase (TIGR04325 family)